VLFVVVFVQLSVSFPHHRVNAVLVCNERNEQQMDCYQHSALVCLA